MRFFWPNKLNPAPSGFTRFGRVLHWIGAALSFPFLAGAIYFAGSGVYGKMYGAQGYLSTSPDSYFGMAIGALMMGLLLYFGGRALRYVFSGE